MLSRITDLKGKLAQKVNVLNALKSSELAGGPNASRRRATLGEVSGLLTQVIKSTQLLSTKGTAEKALGFLRESYANPSNSLEPLIEEMARLVQQMH